MTDKYKLIVFEQGKSSIAEAYRKLRTNIFLAKGDREPRSIMFTSAGPGEGKSTVAANTAVVFAQAGKKVIILDCDLRKPAQHKIFRKKCQGLTNVLTENVPVQQLLVDTGIPGVRLLPGGPVAVNPSELLGMQKMQEVLDQLCSRADHVIVDAPPVMPVTDACVLAAKVDGISLVVGAGVVRREMARQAKELLLQAKGHILGVVLNRGEIEKDQVCYYYYGIKRT